MDRQSEAENRALDARCRLPTAPASRTAVVKLRALPPDRQAFCIVNYAQCDMPHLVRCALDAVCLCCSGPELCSRLTPARRPLLLQKFSERAADLLQPTDLETAHFFSRLRRMYTCLPSIADYTMRE